MSQTTLPNHNHGTSSGFTSAGRQQVARLPRWQIELLQKFTALYPLLITDDDTMSRTLYRSLFDHDQLTYIDTRDSRDALQFCEQYPISLIISNIMKPGMTGIEMLQNLRNHPDIWGTPVIFISGSNHLRETALEAGANSFLSKPCHPNEILQTIWKLLSPYLD